MAGQTLKIALYGSHFPPSGGGGVTSSHVNLFHALKKQGHDVRFFTFLDSNPISEPLRPDLFRSGAPWWLRYLIKAVTRAFFKFLDPGKKAYQTGDILESAWGVLKSNQKLFKFAPDWIILPDHCGPAVFLKKPPRAHVILISHHNPLRFLHQHHIPTHSVKDARLANRLENRALKKVDQVVCPSRYMVGEFKKAYRFTGPIHEIPNLLDIELIRSVGTSDLRDTLSLGPADPLLYIPGAGNALKGSAFVPELVAELCARLPDRRLGFYLAGQIPESFKAAFDPPPPNAALFFGNQIPYLEHLQHVRASTLGISPTVLESYGMAILEAQCVGVPVVAFAREAVPEVITAGQNGALVPPFDLEALVQRTIELLKNPISKNPLLGENLLSAQAQKTLTLWNGVLNPAPEPK